MTDGHSESEAQFEAPSGSADDREQSRYAVDLTVTVDSEHNFYAASAQNLSEGGIFVATHIVHPIGTQFNVSIHVDDGQPGVVRGVGEVRWIRPASEDPNQPQGLGLRFLELEGDGAKRIARFLERRKPLMLEEPEPKSRRGGTT